MFFAQFDSLYPFRFSLSVEFSLGLLLWVALQMIFWREGIALTAALVIIVCLL